MAPFFSTFGILSERIDLFQYCRFALPVLRKLKSRYSGEEVTAFIALVAMLVWFCSDLIFAGKIPLFRDLGSYFYPIKFSVAQAFQRGELPLWDRHMAAGFPVMAGIQSAVFYPPSIVFALLPFVSAIQATFLFHYSVAATGSFILFRWWKCSPYISVIGALLFTFGGTIVSLTNVLNHFQGAVWLPWVILLCERILKVGRRKDFAIFVLVLLCQLLSGSPEIFALSQLLLLIDVIRLYREQEIRSLVKTLVILAAVDTVVVGLAMVQLLPTAELISQSRRDQAIPAVEAFAWSLQPVSLIGLLLPTAEADSTTPLGLRMLFSGEIPFLISHYIGFIVLIGIISWFYHVHTYDRVILVFLLVISLLLACGRFTPVYPSLYEHISALRIVRFPEKFFFLTFALLIFVAARGLCHLGETSNSRSSSIMAICIVSVWTAVYVFLRWNTPLLVQFIERQGSADMVTPVTAPTLANIFFTLEKQIAISLVIAALFIFRRFKLMRMPLFQTLLVATVFLDLSLAHKPLQFLRDAQFLKSAPRVVNSPPPDHSRLFYYPPGNSLHPSYLSVLANPSYDKTTELPFNNLLPNTGILFGFEYFQDIDALALRSYNDFLYFANPLPREKRNKLLGAMNVRYLISFRPLEIPGVKLAGEFPEHFSWLYEVTNPVPRAYTVSVAIHEQSPQNTFARLTSDDFDPGREVILDTPISIQASGKSNNETVITRYDNSYVQIDARLSDPSILVLTDSYYPGWEVFIDGVKGKILRANHLFRGVELPAGNHRVEFVYDPLSFKLGFVISSLTAVLLISIPCIGWILRRVALQRPWIPLSRSSPSAVS